MTDTHLINKTGRARRSAHAVGWRRKRCLPRDLNAARAERRALPFMRWVLASVRRGYWNVQDAASASRTKVRSPMEDTLVPEAVSSVVSRPEALCTLRAFWLALATMPLTQSTPASVSR
jgi:hypothetical protein